MTILSAGQRLDLYRAQAGICTCCGYMLPPLDKRRLRHDDIISADHALPRSRGGMNRMGNYTLMHAGCNEWKGDSMPTGCEAIWLIAVNERLGIQPAPWWLWAIVPPDTKLPPVRRLRKFN